ncbi:hypothetical protein DB30_04526 [Enhygromyxa salina]|uniref:Uncharacterized protein n=1 Tax=Enhygromyxa salina TaxID=215803 RepID=A0A0C1ZFC7_9BACT|nr:hypothetical protein DB30_04526 [Enhygromyxa salina]
MRSSSARLSVHFGFARHQKLQSRSVATEQSDDACARVSHVGACAPARRGIRSESSFRGLPPANPCSSVGGRGPPSPSKVLPARQPLQRFHQRHWIRSSPPLECAIPSAREPASSQRPTRERRPPHATGN